MLFFEQQTNQTKALRHVQDNDENMIVSLEMIATQQLMMQEIFDSILGAIQPIISIHLLCICFQYSRHLARMKQSATRIDR